MTTPEGAPLFAPPSAPTPEAPTTPEAGAGPWHRADPAPSPLRSDLRGSGRSRRRRRGSVSPGLFGLFVTTAVLAGLLGGLIGAQGELAPGPRRVVEISVAEGGDTERPADSVASTAEQVTPSVVSLEVTSSDGFATGSGFVLSSDGYILTNNHVVTGSGTPTIRVLFADGSKEPAELVGRTVNYDLAVVKVDRTDLPALVLGDSDVVVVGDPVIAIGAPLGLDGTVTTGIVSALNRPVVAGGDTEVAFINALQTDAAINPGNSGGPLVNAAGEVIGINSAIAQPPGTQMAAGSIGLGFAIPSNQARRTATELIETGEATYPVIGVMLDRTYDGEGVMVSRTDTVDGPAVSPGGPGDQAGVQPGDVIVAIDGRPVARPDELIVAIRARAPGDTITLTVRPGGGQDETELAMELDEAVSQ